MAKNIGPWVGVPAERQTVCAVEGCDGEGRPQPCPYDGQFHHHGCVHYECDNGRSGLKFRPRADGWALICDAHYAVLNSAHDHRH